MKTELVKVSGIPNPIEFWIGSNAQDNFDMIDEANEYDMWFHVNNETSGHVIARISDNTEINKKLLNKVIIQGGVMCKNIQNINPNKIWKLSTQEYLIL